MRPLPPIHPVARRHFIFAWPVAAPSLRAAHHRALLRPPSACDPRVGIPVDRPRSASAGGLSTDRAPRRSRPLLHPRAVRHASIGLHARLRVFTRGTSRATSSSAGVQRIDNSQPPVLCSQPPVLCSCSCSGLPASAAGHSPLSGNRGNRGYLWCSGTANLHQSSVLVVTLLFNINNVSV